MTTLVFGAGKSGVAAANLLVARGAAVRITDSKPEGEIALAAKLDPRAGKIFGGHPAGILDGISEIVLSPGVPRNIPVLRDADAKGIPVIAEIELAFRYMRGKIVAITGSNGKSTTTALTGEILAAAGMNPIVAGNIGEPLTGSIDPDNERAYVIELSSFQLETIRTFRADVALLLNITPDHMDRYASLEDYAQAKFRVFFNQTAADCAIVNADGCSIDQLAPCAGNWKNHGAYVSAVAKIANAFLAQGLITPAQKGAIVAAAAQSNCGK